MSRSNGPGVPPNGWPTDPRVTQDGRAPDGRPYDGADVYHDPYYTPPSQPSRQAPPQPGTPHQNGQAYAQNGGRPPRIQAGALPAAMPSRMPQGGLPPGGQPSAYAPQTASAQPYGQAPYVPQQSAPQPYAPHAAAQQHYPPQNHPQAYTPPPQAPSPQPPQRVQPSQPGRAPAQHPGYEQTGRPTQPVYAAGQPAYAPGPAAYAPSPAAYAAPAYVPETTARPTQPSPQRPSAPPEQWPQHSNGHASGPTAHGSAADAHGYDLGNYMPAVTPEPRTLRPTAPPAWQPHADPHEAARQQPPLVNGYTPHYPMDADQDRQALETIQNDDDYDEQHEDDDYEDEPRKTRYGLIAASLLFAIAAGGGLAYAYKMFAGSPTQSASVTPLVKSNQTAVKVKPVDPGGTKFANTDSKMLDQLSGSTSVDTPSDGGPKAVKTYVIPREGSPNSGPPQADVAAPVAARPVPGMILAGIPPAMPAPAPAAAPVTVQPPVVKTARVPVAAAVPPPPAAAPYETAQAAPAAIAVKKPIVKKVAPPSAVGGPPVSAGANGFVAVLASVPASASSRMDAMQQYADLQQRFGGVLASKSPDVVEAKLGEKGTFHRLVVGPPGSRESAGAVCSQLKAAGYTADCWVTGF